MCCTLRPLCGAMQRMWCDEQVMVFGVCTLHVPECMTRRRSSSRPDVLAPAPHEGLEAMGPRRLLPHIHLLLRNIHLHQRARFKELPDLRQCFDGGQEPGLRPILPLLDPGSPVGPLPCRHEVGLLHLEPAEGDSVYQ